MPIFNGHFKLGDEHYEGRLQVLEADGYASPRLDDGFLDGFSVGSTLSFMGQWSNFVLGYPEMMVTCDALSSEKFLVPIVPSGWEKAYHIFRLEG